MLYEIHSSKTLEQIDAALRDSAARNKFGVLGVHNLREKMKEKGVEYAQDCLVFEVCNPQQAKIVLEANPSISTALPCRISVHGKPGQYTVSTILPTKLLEMFHAPQLQKVAQEVEQAVIRIMDDTR